MAEMTRIDKNKDTQYMFDTSIYMPMGGWTTAKIRLAVASQGAQIWGDRIHEIKTRYRKEGMLSAGGVAIALNGHRGDSLTSENQNANIDPCSMLGSPKEFSEQLRRRGLNRVVIVTEHYVKEPEKPNILPFEHLRCSKGYSFDEANKDLYEYMKLVMELGIEVVVVSGEQRVID